MKKHGASKKRQITPGYACKARIWIENNGETFLGVGRVVLLERIREYGSISAAARSMGMSYKHAWDLVDAMNRQAPAPLVTTSKGGKGGGGAQLTEDAELAMRHFSVLQKKLATFLERESKKVPW